MLRDISPEPMTKTKKRRDEEQYQDSKTANRKMVSILKKQ